MSAATRVALGASIGARYVVEPTADAIHTPAS